jgi:ribosomal protein S6
MSTGDYSANSPEYSQPLELPESATPPPRVPEASEAVEGLTIAEAATAYGLSVSSIRRLLKKGEILGAAKIPGAKGVEYRIPPHGLESLGYKLKETQSGAILTAARANLEAEELARKVKELENVLALEVVRRESAEKQLEAVNSNLADLREALARIPKQIEAPPKRRLFRKSTHS